MPAVFHWLHLTHFSCTQDRFTKAAAEILGARERENLAVADGVICLTSADCSALRSEARGGLLSTAVVRWGHELAGGQKRSVSPSDGALVPAVPYLYPLLSDVARMWLSPDSFYNIVPSAVPGWQSRSGIMFVGFADNPTNALGHATQAIPTTQLLQVRRAAYVFRHLNITLRSPGLRGFSSTCGPFCLPSCSASACEWLRGDPLVAALWVLS